MELTIYFLFTGATETTRSCACGVVVIGDKVFHKNALTNFLVLFNSDRLVNIVF